MSLILGMDHENEELDEYLVSDGRPADLWVTRGVSPSFASYLLRSFMLLEAGVCKRLSV